MVSHQLVYVTGMLEVILAPSDPSGGCGRLRSFPGTRHAWPASLTPLPRPRKPSNNLFEPSEASETFSGAFLSFPTRRKCSAACF